LNWIGFWFLVCYAATPIALQHQERIQVVHSNRVAQKRPAWGHSRNGSHTIAHIKQKRNRTKHTSTDDKHATCMNEHIRNRKWFFVLSFFLGVFYFIILFCNDFFSYCYQIRIVILSKMKPFRPKPATPQNYFRRWMIRLRSRYEWTFSKLPKVIQVRLKLQKQKDFCSLTNCSFNRNSHSLLCNVSGGFGHK